MKSKSILSESSKDIIQGLWIGSRLSRFEYNSIKSYINHGYTYHLYTYGDVENIPDGVIVKDGNTILDAALIFLYEGSIAPFSDLFRYKMLYELGGIWTDCDIICLRRLPILPYIFVSERTILKGAFSSCTKKPPYECKDRKLLNSFIRVPAKSEIMREMYERSLGYREAYLAKRLKGKTRKHNIGLKSYHWLGGSKLLERLVNEYRLSKYLMPAEFAFPLNWWDFKSAFTNVQIIPPSRGWLEPTDVEDILDAKKRQCRGIYLITIHNGWIKNKGLNKNAPYHPHSLFERLDKLVNH